MRTGLNWAEGYYADLEYTSGYYHELGPAHLKFACQSSGLRCSVPQAPTYLELGFGQGVSLGVHAAANQGDFWGVDINPAHVANAQEVAQEAQLRVHLSDEAFATFAKRQDLPQFHIIALHGVWSWISEDNRRILTDLIDRRLAPGGIVYVSYNCQPGWAVRAPVRHLLTLGRDYEGRGRLGPEAQIEAAMEFMQEIAAVEGRFFSDNRPAADHVRGLAKQSRRYLAHEYLNADWHIPYFSEVAKDLGRARLSFATSARLLDRVTDINLKPEGVAMLDRQKDPILRESVRDYLVNQRFRPDVFIKGAVALSPQEQEAVWDEARFVLICPLDEVDFRVVGALGGATLPEALYKPLALALEADAYAPKTLAALQAVGVRRSEIIGALTVLIGKGVVRPVLSEPDEAVVMRCATYNRYVLTRAKNGRHLKHLASPLTQGGLQTSRSTQLFLDGWLDGARSPQDLAQWVWRIFERTNERAVKQDREMATREENLEALSEMASRFIEKIAPMFRALRIIA